MDPGFTFPTSSGTGGFQFPGTPGFGAQGGVAGKYYNLECVTFFLMKRRPSPSKLCPSITEHVAMTLLVAKTHFYIKKKDFN